MILSELKQYLAEHRRVSLTDMVNRFDADPDALRGMLAVLERKGRVRKLDAQVCGGCSKCDPATVELYEIVDS
ncbi:MAG: FeoC-like transcriptional regulator [Thiohalocapsa sp.]|nr:FeoC-like transcriptional regulator [Thiohalocapsa sp.]